MKKVANTSAVVNEVECFLWREAFHPFNLKLDLPMFLQRFPFDLYMKLTPEILSTWIKEADFVFAEAGLPVLFLHLIKTLNSKCKLIYMASDDLITVGASPVLVERFQEFSSHLDLIIAPSKLLSQGMPRNVRFVVIPHGIDENIRMLGDPNPYGQGINAVSVGSMLFDPKFFEIASRAFPKIMFHVIGSGCPKHKLPSDVVYYDEMKFEDTIKFINHAQFGIAPYKQEGVHYYLADTSMKLAQYEFFGLPAVCPEFAAREHRDTRFGYDIWNESTVVSSIETAIQRGRFPGESFPNWARVGKLIWKEVID